MTEEFPYTMAEVMGADGDILLGAFMPARDDVRGPVIAFSRDGRTFTFLNDGEPVFVIPGHHVDNNVARDFSLLQQRLTCRYLTAFTAGAVGTSGYISIWGSLSLRKGSWSHVTNVYLPSVVGAGGTLWGPKLVEDRETGKLYMFFAGCEGQNIGSDLRGYWIEFNNPEHPENGHSDPVLVQVPAVAQNYSLNEFQVFENEHGTGWLMQVFAFNPPNTYQVYGCQTLTGQWAMVQDVMQHAPREGVFSLPLPNGGWRVYSVDPSTQVYGFVDLPGNFSVAELSPMTFSPLTFHPKRTKLENGEMIWCRTPLAPLFSQVSIT